MIVWILIALIAYVLRDWLIAAVRDMKYLARIVSRHFSNDVHFSKPMMYHLNGPQTPIILVHGSSGNQLEWIESEKYLARYFKNHPIYAFTLDLSFDSYTGDQENLTAVRAVRAIVSANNWNISQYSYELGQRIAYVRAQHNCDKVILIGHSMGGLIAARYECDFPEHVLCVVGISSPFQGAPLLKYHPVRYVNSTERHIQMTPGSDFLTRLHDDVQERKNKYLTFGSLHDIQVPDHAAQLHTHRTIERYGHFSIVSCENIWHEIRTWLQNFLKRAE